jgi:hypothetical protein
VDLEEQAEEQVVLPEPADRDKAAPVQLSLVAATVAIQMVEVGESRGWPVLVAQAVPVQYLAAVAAAVTLAAVAVERILTLAVQTLAEAVVAHLGPTVQKQTPLQTQRPTDLVPAWRSLAT